MSWTWRVKLFGYLWMTRECLVHIKVSPVTITKINQIVTDYYSKLFCITGLKFLWFAYLKIFLLSLLAFVAISCIQKYYEKWWISDTPSFCDYIYGLIWNSFDIRKCWSIWKSPVTVHSTLSSNGYKFNNILKKRRTILMISCIFCS